jgi:Zn-dependent peptidase ImmA (M78 family)
LLKTKKVENVARLLAKEIKHPGKHCASIEELINTFGIQIQYQSLVGNGYLALQDGRYVVAVNKGLSSASQRFTMAHELAHWVLQEKFGIRCKSASGSFEFDEAIERACDYFGCLVLLPMNPPDIAPLRRRGVVDFDSLEKIARGSRVPLRSVLIHVQNSGLLNATEQAIITFRPMTNPWEGNNWELRVWHSACPAWGFIPDSEKVAKIGFSNLVQSWHEFANRSQIKMSEHFSVMVKNEDELGEQSGDCKTLKKNHRAGPIWKRVEMQEDVHYKVYGNADEGIFIVAVFRWKRPWTA